MPKQAARYGDPVTHPNPPTLSTPGPASPDVFMEHKKAWRAVDAAASAAIQNAKKASDAVVDAAVTARETAEKATIAAAAPPALGLPAAQTAEKAAKAAEQAAKAAALSSMSSLISSMSMGSDIHMCNVPSPSPPHGPGVVVDASKTVFINGKPAARQDDKVIEPLGPPNPIKQGCPTVFIGDDPPPMRAPSVAAASPAPGSAAASPAGDRVIRQDNDFSATTNTKGVPKSRIDASGAMVPANPAGKTTPLEHIYGSSPAKDNSPYTSLMTEEAGSVGKAYGAQEVEIDMPKLQADIASGKLKDVEVISPGQLQTMIKDDIQKVKPGFDPDAALADPAGIQAHVQGKGLSRGATDKLVRRLIALSNTSRDGEWLVKGVIPSEYLQGPYPS